MNNILLINRINPNDDNNNSKKKIFFLLGGMNFSSAEIRLKELLDKIDILDKKDIIYKYNGVLLDITTKEIPSIIKELIEGDFSIYSIYEIYTPGVWLIEERCLFENKKKIYSNSIDNNYIST